MTGRRSRPADPRPPTRPLALDGSRLAANLAVLMGCVFFPRQFHFAFGLICFFSSHSTAEQLGPLRQ
jgi:hypothetical protein